MRVRSFRWLAALLVGCFVILTSTSVTTSVKAATGPPTVLAGHVLRNLPTFARLGDAPGTQTVNLTVVFKPQSPGLIDQTLAKQRAAPPTHPLSADDVAQSIGQPQSTLDQVSGFFRAGGFTVDSIAPDHLSLRVTGTVAQTEQALAVHVGNYRDRKGRTFRATSDDPSVPAALAGTIQAIVGLDTYPTLDRLNQPASPQLGAYAPADIQVAYNVSPLLNRQLNGTGETIGVIGCDMFLASDILGFDQTFDLPQTVVNQINVDGGADQGNVETTLDLEWAHAIAPGANISFYGFPGCQFNTFLDAITQAANDPATSVISISLGTCEQTYASTPDGSSTFLTAMENEFASAALQNKSIFVASGDQGADACTDSLGNPAPGVSYPASSAYVTAVGGTSLTLTASSAYESETAWGDTCTGGSGGQVACGTGGGISSAIAEPSWQTSASTPILPTGGKRGLPDVALDADPATGYAIYWTDPAGSCTGYCTGFGGTSIAAPEWAGIAAIANQFAKRPLGQFSPLLYGPTVLATRTTSQPDYHDVTTGSDGLPPDNVYSAAPGWDFTTGWGSPNACLMVQSLAGATPAVSRLAAVTGSSTSALNQIFLPILFQGSSQSMC